ncbi:MAG: DegT/DnrJ/EryC1/StrS family aminotransferase [Candidatus Omnitrophica bacterium]|nr:DegT/DnrJ/EryC1/StrS family aminotransferase [Candidatus Omnitrophota bacterium]
MKIEFYKHNLGLEEKAKVAECLDGVFLTTGAYVREFEEKFAAYLGVRHAIGLTSCTAGLHLALLALDIGPGDEVITTPMTFIATANAIVYVGAKPVFIDVDSQTGLMDINRIEQAITPKTKAIIPVHLYGQMCDMKAISGIAARHGLKVIEDCAHCVEGARDGIRPGQLSDAACFSFYATKNLTSGEGGAVTVNDNRLDERIRVLRQHGMSKGAADRYGGNYKHWDMIELGWKYNMSNIQAAMLLPQIPKIEKNWVKRDSLYQHYMKALKGITGVDFLRLLPGVKSAHHLLTVLVDAQRRDSILHELGAQGIGCAVNYRAIHLLSFYRERYGFKENDFPNAESIGSRTITLPFWVGLTNEQVAYVACALRKALKDC